MDLDLGPAFTRAQAVVNGLVAAISGLVVALVVFGAFLLTAAIVKGVVARPTEARLHAHRNAGVSVGRLAQGLVIFLGLIVALSVAVPTFRPGDGDRVRQREGWPAGHTDVPASRKVADAIQHLSGSKARGAEAE